MTSVDSDDVTFNSTIFPFDDDTDFINDTVTNDTIVNELSRFSRPLLTFSAVMIIIIMVVGVTGNLLTVVALTRCPRVRNVTAAFIISLCIADLIFCSTVLPFSASRFIHGRWTHGAVLCVMFPLLRYTNVGVSLFSIGMITFNRYILIAHTRLYRRIYQKKWIAMMIAFSWIFSFGMLVPTLLGKWGKFGYHPLLQTCTILKVNGKSSKTTLFLVAFILPCVAIICCYSRIFWVVHSSEKRMRFHSVSDNKSLRKQEKDIKKRKNEYRVTKMALAIFVSFVVCYLPITIVKVADKHIEYPGLHVLSYVLVYGSACVNPIIYVIMNKQYRQAYRTVLTCRRPRHKSVSLNSDRLRHRPLQLVDSDVGSSGSQFSRTMVSQVAMSTVSGSHGDDGVFENRV